MSEEIAKAPHPTTVRGHTLVVPAALVALGLALRIGWVLLVPSKPVGDFAMYRESAAYLLEHGALDDTFIYMPGYVLLLAAVQAVGGGLLASKLLGAVLGGLSVGSVFGITNALWSRRAAIVAAALFALWPGGVAVASVTGTDMPATAFILAGTWWLVRHPKERAWRAAAGFGLCMGAASYVRAVALPLTALALLHLLALRVRWRRALSASAVAVVLATCVLAPWALRNHARYGEWFLTDSHGGLTALVGAYPNSDGHFTRALNRTFEEVTGLRWLEEPHRHADRVAYQHARTWVAFSPGFTFGLHVQRMDKLLGDERSLLYWPLYRAGVLPDAKLGFFARWRRELEVVVDTFYLGLLLLSFAGLGLALARRRWVALSPVPLQAALCAVYILYFAESRYHLPIVALAFPSAAGALVFLAGEVAVLARRVSSRASPARAPALSALVLSALLPALLVGAFFALLPLGQQLRDRHRWAVHRCRVDGQARFCSWRSDGPGPSPVRGVYDGVGLRLSQSTAAAAIATLPVSPGRHRVRARIEARAPATPPPSPVDGQLRLVDVRKGHGAQVSLTTLASADGEATVDFVTAVDDGALTLRLAGDSRTPGWRVWLTDLEVESITD